MVAKSPIGTETKKIRRHWIGPRIPPSTRPRNDPLMPATWLMPSAMPRWCSGKASVRRAPELAMRKAAPTPWNIRITIRYRAAAEAHHQHAADDEEAQDHPEQVEGVAGPERIDADAAEDVRQRDEQDGRVDGGHQHAERGVGQDRPLVAVPALVGSGEGGGREGVGHTPGVPVAEWAMTPSVAPWRVRPAHRPTLMGLLPSSSSATSPMQRSYLYVNGREPSVLVEVAAAPLPGTPEGPASR